MLSNQSNQSFKIRAGRIVLVSAVFGVTLGLGGCSADVSRFDLGKYSYNNSDGPTGSLPSPSEPMATQNEPQGRSGERYPRADAADSGAGGAYERKYSSSTRDAVAARRQRVERNDVRASKLDDLSAPRRPTRMISSLPDQSRSALGADLGRRAPSRASGLVADNTAGALTGSQSIIVERGDTLYGLSRRHGVSVSAIKRANGLRTAMIKPGQSLTIPGDTNGRAAPTRAAPTRSAPTQRIEPAADQTYRTASRQPARAAARDRASNDQADYANAGSQRYTIRSGDSFYRIAREHGLPMSELVAANPDANPRRLRPGQSLIIPGRSGRSGGAEGVNDGYASDRSPRVVNTSRYDAAGRSKRVASLRSNTMNDAAPGIRKIEPRVTRSTAPITRSNRVAAISPAPKRSSAGRFRWPVRGKVISRFGPRNDGTHNDGINLSVPQGTKVQAAENGVVAYAGSELKGYGKLILVRHDNNWVTAYAHNNSIMVKRGDKIRRGQVIAKAGKTGTVDRPQVHFELRKGSKPVNPLPYLQ